MIRSSYHYLLCTLVRTAFSLYGYEAEFNYFTNKVKLVLQAVDQLDLSGFHFGGVNITGFRLMSNTNERLRTFRQDWLKFNPVIDVNCVIKLCYQNYYLLCCSTWLKYVFLWVNATILQFS